MHITGIFLVITMATTYPEKKMKRIVLPTVRITESLHHRVLQYVHLTVTKIKRIREKLNLKQSVYLKKNCLCGIWNAHFCTEESSLVLS